MTAPSPSGAGSAVLVADGWTRKALPMVRALGRHGYRVDVLSNTPFAPAAYSRYCRRRIASPDPAVDADAFAAFLIALLRGERYAGFLPLEDATLDAVLPVRADLEGLVPVALPPSSGYAIAQDKWQTLQVARDIGVPIPRSERPVDIDDATVAANAIGFPLVIKPVRSSGSRGLRFVEAVDTFRAAYEAVA